MYGLAGRIEFGGGFLGASSLGSLGDTSRSVALSVSPSISAAGYCPCPFVGGSSERSRSMGCRRLCEDLIEAVSASRSFPLTEVRRKEWLLCAAWLPPFIRCEVNLGFGAVGGEVIISLII